VPQTTNWSKNESEAMKEDTLCLCCKEEANAAATPCKNCGSPLDLDPKAAAMATAILRTIDTIQKISHQISLPSSNPSAGIALCYFKSGHDKAILSECLDTCNTAPVVGTTAEKLQAELRRAIGEVVWGVTFEEIIRGGGEIYPKPFEEAVRERLFPDSEP